MIDSSSSLHPVQGGKGSAAEPEPDGFVWVDDTGRITLETFVSVMIEDARAVCEGFSHRLTELGDDAPRDGKVVPCRIVLMPEAHNEPAE